MQRRSPHPGQRFAGVPRMWSHAAPETLLAPEPALPAQVLHLWHHTCAIEPERALALAVLSQAVADVQRYQQSGLAHHRALFDAARDWMYEEDQSWPYSFVNLCLLFNLTPESVRDELLNRPATRRAA
ncbi:MAG: hypothetical protein SF182_12540 [Deltaproteobacteria bacterium]|nr:hypothetical protein [Deltaproteobacteria bacterium]